MKFVRFGIDDGPAVFYFHGCPGAASEGRIFAELARECGLSVYCPNRMAIDAGITGAQYWAIQAEEITRVAENRDLHLVGFSIGALAAIRVGLLTPQPIRSLNLVSAAAPLTAENAYGQFAGKPVFDLATRHPLAFSWLARGQSLLARRQPDLLYRILFARAGGKT